MRRSGLRTITKGITLVSLLVGFGCRQQPKNKEFAVRGKVLNKDVAAQQITLDHGDVPGFMPAMTMDYKLPNAPVVEELQPGDRIAAKIVVDPKDASHYWLQDVVITDEADRKNPPAKTAARELVVGDVIPDVPLVDQDGRRFHLRDYQGEVVLLTFIYTRCPMPTFCPLISSHFASIHNALKKEPAIYGEVQLVSVSLDPAYDTPPVLRRYGLAYVDGSSEDLKHWTFASTSSNDLKTLAEAFGLEYFTEGNQITHTMSTVLISKQGAVVRVWKGNEWKWNDVLSATRSAVQK